ncbi:ribosome recycling factor [Thermosulfuriphilus ammonigenes]|uniref:Ribosome-recycling factor n=1 Tax=Thermosulfuriphilus ammonigenes TaxID=1936021 RepID=A0A6G7PX09_9BACT|nr:ribosome recycling factor [Thermosulfuriphilus ammonigenes]MBA2849680.1 ribosome recycling factor [Thermosulfuriphilus ammonigenes]QIJ72224.1 ribosome recycling factor [Thermosulfuriphilus ammonigenes]HFB83336.1 ribosome recycling factor [Thermodesulfatator sp.]
MKTLIKQTREKMDKSIEAFRREIARVRTGRASVALLDGIKVEYYGNPMPLNQVATISVSEGRTIVIQPWDASIISEIEKAIMRSDLGLTPTSDGKIIRINVPPLTEERRKELVKVVRKMAEEGRVALRNIRREALDQLKSMKKNKEISEDDFYRGQEEVQKVTDEYIKKVDKILEEKEKEIMSV